MINTYIRRLWRHIPNIKKKRFICLVILMVLTSLLELVSIGSILPFLSVLVEPSRAFTHPSIQPILVPLGIHSPAQLIAPFAVFFGAAVMTAGVARLTLLNVSTRLCFETGADLSAGVYERTLFQPYSVHISRNSSELISGVTGKITAVIFGVVVPSVSLVNAIIMLIVVCAALMIIDPIIAASAVGGFGLIYAFVLKKTRHRVAVAGKLIAFQSSNVIKVMQEGLGGIRDILLDGTQETYCNAYRKADTALRNAQRVNQFIGESPRYIIESLGMSLIAALAYMMAQDPESRGNVIPILGAFALGAQRVLPLLQQAFASITSLRGSKAALEDVLDLLDQPTTNFGVSSGTIPLTFDRQISLRKISLRYGLNGPWVLRNIDLIVEKGSRIGFIGVTGSGKSSFLDVLMGLIPPTEGELEVDGTVVTQENMRSWQVRLAHVPQSIYLCDASVAENIAFGLPPAEIDHDRVRGAAREAQISFTIESWQMGYETRVGERGVRLSGGQRQRIGIARALYKRADVIIFDEATSALDDTTEKAVMDAIDSLGEGLTVFIVAHRLSTLKKCSRIIELVDGKISREGSYAEIVGR